MFFFGYKSKYTFFSVRTASDLPGYFRSCFCRVDNRRDHVRPLPLVCWGDAAGEHVDPHDPEHLQLLLLLHLLVLPHGGDSGREYMEIIYLNGLLMNFK